MSAHDLLPLSEACDYLKRSEVGLLLAVAEGAIRVGVLAKAWIAYAQSTGGGHFDGHVTAYGDTLRTLRFTHVESASTYTVQEFFAAQFWYLHHATAYALITSRDGVISKSLALEPHDGTVLHAARPDAFPWAEFVAICPVDRNPELSLAKQDLLFLRQDLDELKPEKPLGTGWSYNPATGVDELKPEKPLGTTERENLLRMIYYMAKDRYGWQPGDKKSPIPGELAKLTGLSDDTIRRHLQKAKLVADF